MNGTLKNRIQNIPVKIRILGLFSVICLLLAGVVWFGEHQIQKDLYDQQMAKRWSKEENVSQISAFFAEGAVEDENYFRQIEQGVDKALKEASVVSENPNARLWVDAVSKYGKVILNSQRGNVELNAMGVSGEFFQFHPQKIVSGSLFSQDSMMQDGIVIDEETAWQLFGSSDVAGMPVMIGQVPHLITGVIERPSGRLEKAAGLEKSVCYLSLESLQKYGTVSGGFAYEIVMPNPIKGFAISTMQTSVGNENKNVILVENSDRFKVLSLIRVIKNFGIRSMSFQGIVFPYWENIARGVEDILALLLCIKCMLLLVPSIFLIGLIRCLWKKRTWRLRTAVMWIQDKIYEAGTRRVQKRQKNSERINQQENRELDE